MTFWLFLKTFAILLQAPPIPHPVSGGGATGQHYDQPVAQTRHCRLQAIYDICKRYETPTWTYRTHTFIDDNVSLETLTIAGARLSPSEMGTI